MEQKILPGIVEVAEEMVKVRRHLHQHPELGFEEYQTSDLVAKLLEEWGYSVTRDIAGTGVVGQLRSGVGRSIGLRADMDALPIYEMTGVPYVSIYKGKMHACGHDGHTASLLAAARYLAEYKPFKGTINLIFQPAEEGIGGAKKMVEEGLFEQFPCDAIFAFHNIPGFATGQMGFRAGPMMASSDNVTITIQGRGGHGAMPHLAVDPIVVASSIVMALQSIVSRNVDPLEMAVITVGSIQAGSAHNIIPDSATLKLNIRALSSEIRASIIERIQNIVELQAQSYGAMVEIDFHEIAPILINDIAYTDLAREIADVLYGEENIITDLPQMTGSEDFAYMLNEIPGCYFYIGNGLEGAHGCSIHNPSYDFNDEILPLAANYWVVLVSRFLS